MPCDTTVGPDRIQPTLERLRVLLSEGSVTVAISPQGSIAFRSWTESNGMTDLCAYRALTAANSWELRRAIARAEVMSGRKVSQQTVAIGTHSHDGGATWHDGH